MLNFSAALSCYWSLFDHLGGGNDGLKDLTDPPYFSPETRATETLKTSPETTERMASLILTDNRITEFALQFIQAEVLLLNQA